MKYSSLGNTNYDYDNGRKNPKPDERILTATTKDELLQKVRGHFDISDRWNVSLHDDKIMFNYPMTNAVFLYDIHKTKTGYSVSLPA